MAGIIFYDLNEDWQNLLPFTYTRPITSIRLGIMSIAEKWSFYLGLHYSWLTEIYLREKFPFIPSGDDLIINSTILPDGELMKAVKTLKAGHSLFSNDIFIAANAVENDVEQLVAEDFKTLEKINYTGNISKIRYSWDIFGLNHREIIADFNALTKNRKSERLSSTNKVIGNGTVFLEEGAKAECCIFNTTEGPVYIGKNAEIMEGSLLRGPLAICEYSTIKMGAKIYTGTTIGPHCKVGGEVSNSVFNGYSNKAHDGFLGNAVIGEWCNLGADTNNSNLKNNYEKVKVWNYRQKQFISTGLQFCGLFMGDHSKSSINMMFNTGTTVGICCNVYGAGFPRTYIPSFSWGGASAMTIYEIESAFKTAEIVMQRRNIPFTEADKNIFSTVYKLTQDSRK